MAEADSELWLRVSTYLDRALELDSSELEPWLAALDSAHPQLAAELRELLALHAANRASGFMERSPLGPDESLVASASALTPSSVSWAAAAWAVSGSDAAATANLKDTPQSSCWTAAGSGAMPSTRSVTRRACWRACHIRTSPASSTPACARTANPT